MTYDFIDPTNRNYHIYMLLATSGALIDNRQISTIFVKMLIKLGLEKNGQTVYGFSLYEKNHLKTPLRPENTSLHLSVSCLSNLHLSVSYLCNLHLIREYESSCLSACIFLCHVSVSSISYENTSLHVFLHACVFYGCVGVLMMCGCTDDVWVY